MREMQGYRYEMQAGQLAIRPVLWYIEGVEWEGVRGGRVCPQ